MLRILTHILLLSILVPTLPAFGLAGPRLDFDGDGKTDFVVAGSLSIGGQAFQHVWFFRRPGGYISIPWGGGDPSVPDGYDDHLVPEDYDGDGKTDIAVWRQPYNPNWPSSGAQCYFWILYSSNSTYAAIPWGATSSILYTDTEAPQDYDGDHKADIAIKRSGSFGASWWILQSSDGSVRHDFLGHQGAPVHGDYDGDGKADIGVAERSDTTTNARYNFFIRKSSNGQMITASFGRYNGDMMAPGDYDGDGKTDIALWGGSSPEFSDGLWKWIKSSDGQTIVARFGSPFGIPAINDYKAQGDYDGDGITDLAIYRADHFGNCNVPSYSGYSAALQEFRSPSSAPATAPSRGIDASLFWREAWLGT